MSTNAKIYTEQGAARQVVASGGSLDVESGGEIDIESGGSLKIAGTAVTASAAELNQNTLVTNSDRVPNIAKVALTASDAAAGVFAWQNPESSAILVSRCLVDVTTAATGACTLNIGLDSDGTSSADTLIDGLDVNTAAGLFDNIADKGTNGAQYLRVDANGGSNDYITASVATGASAGLVGNAYIEYVIV